MPEASEGIEGHRSRPHGRTVVGSGLDAQASDGIEGHRSRHPRGHGIGGLYRQAASMPVASEGYLWHRSRLPEAMGWEDWSRRRGVGCACQRLPKLAGRSLAFENATAANQTSNMPLSDSDRRIFRFELVLPR